MARKTRNTNPATNITPDLFNFPQGQSVVESEVFADTDRVKEFVLAGKSKFTIKSDKTGQHYTYKVDKGDTPVWFVKRLTSENRYVYMGTIFEGEGFRATPKTSDWVRNHDKSFEAFKWFWEKLNSTGLPDRLTFYHAGRCGMCGLELTDPVSLKLGYGPDCAKKRLRHSMIDDR